MVFNEVFIAEMSNCLDKYFIIFDKKKKQFLHFLFGRIFVIFVHLTDMKTSSACCKMATRVQPNFFNNFIRVGLCTVADGCVRNNVGNRLRSDSAGLDAP